MSVLVYKEDKSKSKDISSSGLRNPFVMKGSILTVPWKAFRHNKERFSLLKTEKASKHPIHRYLEVENPSPAVHGGLPVPQK